MHRWGTGCASFEDRPSRFEGFVFSHPDTQAVLFVGFTFRPSRLWFAMLPVTSGKLRNNHCMGQCRWGLPVMFLRIGPSTCPPSVLRPQRSASLSHFPNFLSCALAWHQRGGRRSIYSRSRSPFFPAFRPCTDLLETCRVLEMFFLCASRSALPQVTVGCTS